MSLGWSCESAILPRKARPIEVDSSSFERLKNLVSAKEQNVTKNSNSFSDLRKEKVASKKQRDKMKDELGGKKSVRAEKDEKDAQAARALAAKAKLYEDIMNGKVNGKSALVNFEEKVSVEPPVAVNKPEPKKHVVEEPIIVTENSTLAALYPWSTGQINYTEEYLDEKASEKNLRQIIEERINAEAPISVTSSSSSSSVRSGEINFKQPALDKNSTSGSISEAARIKTMWEQTLNNSARTYIDEIHQETEEARKRQKETEHILQELKRRKREREQGEGVRGEKKEAKGEEEVEEKGK